MYQTQRKQFVTKVLIAQQTATGHWTKLEGEEIPPTLGEICALSLFQAQTKIPQSKRTTLMRERLSQPNPQQSAACISQVGASLCFFPFNQASVVSPPRFSLSVTLWLLATCGCLSARFVNHQALRDLTRTRPTYFNKHSNVRYLTGNLSSYLD